MKKNPFESDFINYRCYQKPVPFGATRLMDVKPPSHYNHYSNPNSNGALIIEAGRGDYYFKNKEEVCSGYSDRFQMWNAEHYSELCKKIGTGEQAWARALLNHSEESLLNIGQFAFKKNKNPIYVRFVHWYDVSSGFSCPSIEAIFEKDENTN